jgi:probable F420-dependent oxidoreductase
MKVDIRLQPDLLMVKDAVSTYKAFGFAGLWTTESSHDPFLPLAVAASLESGLDLGTSIAVAFARTPMTIATVSHHLQVASGGHFIIGLGTQVKPHIEKRFGMPWSRPAARMAEFVDALYAIWRCWDEGEPLDFRGEFYQHTLSTPFFQPPPTDLGPPKVYVAAVGQLMTEVVGAHADGLLVHGFTTERYLREVTLPTLESGLQSRAQRPSKFEVLLPGLVASGDTEESMETSIRRTRRQIAFYASTPAYRPVLELHGWEDIQPELNRLSKLGEWREMRNMIDDEMLDTFAIVAEPHALAARIAGRFGGLADRFSFYNPVPGSPEEVAQIVRDLNAVATTAQ